MAALPRDMIDIRSAGSAGTTGSHMYALGGTDNAQNIHYSIEYLDLESCAWKYGTNMTVSRMDHASCVISDSLLVGGGQNGDVLSTVEFYRPELEEWTRGPTMLTPRYGHQMLTVNL